MASGVSPTAGTSSGSGPKIVHNQSSPARSAAAVTAGGNHEGVHTELPIEAKTGKGIFWRSAFAQGLAFPVKQRQDRHHTVHVFQIYTQVLQLVCQLIPPLWIGLCHVDHCNKGVHPLAYLFPVWAHAITTTEVEHLESEVALICGISCCPSA
eukprot:CAMPEP_0195612148 /NCGR_PEP_ID=MMETSP0815-20121206/10712_1 /TAXON_ID=97485 /ORGANISM="Prymnesium parvum, Strain Texoma1" /LENGTH=152 /DNA_ID=CAMNT_0040752233 /DNA_START=455 /DNA_END=912 /DNA_ORIENTATION=+